MVTQKGSSVTWRTNTKRAHPWLSVIGRCFLLCLACDGVASILYYVFLLITLGEAQVGSEAYINAETMVNGLILTNQFVAGFAWLGNFSIGAVTRWLVVLIAVIIAVISVCSLSRDVQDARRWQAQSNSQQQELSYHR